MEQITTSIASGINLTEEEVYDIFRDVFRNEEDALAAATAVWAIQLLGMRIMINVNTNKANKQSSLILISRADR